MQLAAKEQQLLTLEGAIESLLRYPTVHPRFKSTHGICYNLQRLSDERIDGDVYFSCVELYWLLYGKPAYTAWEANDPHRVFSYPIETLYEFSSYGKWEGARLQKRINFLHILHFGHLFGYAAVERLYSYLVGIKKVVNGELTLYAGHTTHKLCGVFIGAINQRKLVIACTANTVYPYQAVVDDFGNLMWVADSPTDVNWVEF